MSQLQIGNINIYKVQIYLEESKLARKLHGFVEKLDEKSGKKSLVHIQSIQAFLGCLINCDAEGTLITDINSNFTDQKYHGIR